MFPSSRFNFFGRGICRTDSTGAVASDLSSLLGQEMVRSDTETSHLIRITRMSYRPRYELLSVRNFFRLTVVQCFRYAFASAAFTRSVVKGTERSLMPVASKTALAKAAATGALDASPAP